MVDGVVEEKGEGVGEEGEQDGEAFLYASWAPGEVDDEGVSGDSGAPTREDRAGVLAITFHAEGFGEAGGIALDYVGGGFGGNVAAGESGSAGGEDQGTFGAHFTEGGGDPGPLVGHQLSASNLKAGGEELLDNAISGGVLPFAARAAVADGQHSGGDSRFRLLGQFRVLRYVFPASRLGGSLALPAPIPIRA